MIGKLSGTIDEMAGRLRKVLYPEFAGAAVYLLMAVVLLFRPAGLFGRT